MTYLGSQKLCRSCASCIDFFPGPLNRGGGIQDFQAVLDILLIHHHDILLDEHINSCLGILTLWAFLLSAL